MRRVRGRSCERARVVVAEDLVGRLGGEQRQRAHLRAKSVEVSQVAILGVGASELKPVRRGDEVVFVDYLNLSLTINHQIIDGAPGARFLQTLRNIIENFDMYCVAR